MSDSDKDFDFDSYIEDLKNTPPPEEFNQEDMVTNIDSNPQNIPEEIIELLAFLSILSDITGSQFIVRKK